MADIETFNVPPVVKTLALPVSIERGFELFAHNISDWWPFATHSVSQDEKSRLEIGYGLGSALTEVAPDGSRHEWGAITAWQPPGRMAFTWHPGRSPDSAQTVTLDFTQGEAGGCELTLTHSGWENLGEDAQAMRGAYAAGWTSVLEKLERFVGE